MPDDKNHLVMNGECDKSQKKTLLLRFIRLSAQRGQIRKQMGNLHVNDMNSFDEEEQNLVNSFFILFKQKRQKRRRTPSRVKEMGEGDHKI